MPQKKLLIKYVGGENVFEDGFIIPTAVFDYDLDTATVMIDGFSGWVLKAPINDRENGTLAYPVHLAAGLGRVKMLESLLTAGAKMDVRDFDGATPLHRAAMSGHRNVVDLLSQKGAKMKVADSNFQSPADYAASRGHEALANHLRSLAQ